MHHTALAPQHPQIAEDFFVARSAVAVVLEVNAGAGAVVFAGGVNGLGRAKAAFVVGQRLRFDVAQALATPAAELGVQIGLGGFGVPGAHHGFGQRRRLQHVKPMVISAGKVHVRHAQAAAFVHVQRGRDVDHAQPGDARRMVQRQPVRHAPAPVMAANAKLGHAQRIHHRHRVLRQVALAVVAVVAQAGLFGRIAIAPQIRHDQKEMRRQQTRYALPHHMTLRKAVQEQQRRLRLPARHTHRKPCMNACAIDFKRALLKSLKPGHQGLLKVRWFAAPIAKFGRWPLRVCLCARRSPPGSGCAGEAALWRRRNFHPLQTAGRCCQ